MYKIIKRARVLNLHKGKFEALILLCVIAGHEFETS